MDILITGGNGLLGRHLVRALRTRGERIRVLTLPGEDTSWLEAQEVAVFRGDVRIFETLAAPMRGVETVLHLAGMMGVWRPLADYRAVNVGGTENVARAVLAEGARRLVHVSSWTVYGMDLGRPATEDFPLTPFAEPYAISKTEGDRLIQQLFEHRGLSAVIVRPGTFFGPGDRLHFGRMADRVASRRALIVGSGRNALPFVYVTDVVQGLLRALDDPAALGRAYNITNDQPMTQQGFLEAIAEELGAPTPRTHAPYAALYAVGAGAEGVANRVPLRRQPPLTRLGVKLFGTDNRHSIERARRELGYTPRVPVREGVSLAAAWYREQTARSRKPARATVHPIGTPAAARPRHSTEPSAGTGDG
jgi:nucleoside-diphosphate-sugar epimerase